MTSKPELRTPETRTIEVLQPVIEDARPTRALSTRPPDLTGLTLGIVGDSQQNTEAFMAALEALFLERHRLRGVVRCNRNTGQIDLIDPSGEVTESFKAPGPVLDEVVRLSDVAIDGVGH
jgi:type II secretory pathway component PulJ